MSSAPKLITSAWQQEVTDEWNSPVDSTCIGVGEGMEPENILHLATDLGFWHVCQKQGHEFDKELKSAQNLVGNEDLYREFPLSVILTPDAVSKESERSLLAYEQQFDSSNQKREGLDSLSNVAQTRGISQTVIDDLIAVADELFTNAIFNAPFVDINTQKNPGINRHTGEVKLDGGKFARMFLAHHENRLVIGCSDPYGSLDLKRYLNKIKATYLRGPAATMNFGAGGAGIGSYIIFNAGSSLYFGVWPGQATVICCVIPVGISNRKRLQLPKHLHWFQR